MAWSLIIEEIPALLTAFADAEAILWPALRDALYPFKLHPPIAEIEQFRPEKSTWRLGYQLWLPYERLAPYERFDCELHLAESIKGRDVTGWIGVQRYCRKGVSLEDSLFQSPDCEVETPATAAVAIETAAAQLAQQMSKLDLRSYLAGRPIDPV